MTNPVNNDIEADVSPDRKSSMLAIGRIALVWLPLIAGIVLGTLCWDHINLPFHNPYHVFGLLTIAKCNPNTGLVRFACFLLWPLVLLLAMDRIRVPWLVLNCFTEPSAPPSGPSGGRFVLIGTVALVLVAVVGSFYVHWDLEMGSQVDTFHEGESLGPASLYMRGQVPYRDFFFCHGPFQDPLRSVIAFKMFGRSIGAERAMESIVKLLGYALLGVFLAQICGGQMWVAFSVLAAFIGFHLATLTPAEGDWRDFAAFSWARNVTAYLFLIAILATHRHLGSDKPRAAATTLGALACSFIAVGSVTYSLDVGLYLTAACLILCPLLYSAYVRRSPLRVHFLAGSIAGVVLAVGLLALSVKGNLVGFFEYHFITQPKYWGLLTGLVFKLDPWPFWAAMSLVAVNSFWVLLQFLRVRNASRYRLGPALHAFADNYFPELALWVCSLFFFTRGTSRADWNHISVGATLSYLLACVIIFRHYLPQLLRGPLRTLYVLALVLVVLGGMVVGVAGLCSGKRLAHTFPVGVKDAELIPESYLETAEFLKDNLRPGETFYACTDERIWYYLVEKPSPTRHMCPYYAAPDFLQRQAVRELKAADVKFIIATNDKQYNIPAAGTPNAQLVPIIVDYLSKNYTVFTRIDDQVIMIKRSPEREDG